MQRSAPLCTGDNRVAVEDISLLGGHFGVGDTSALYLTCLDVGPTVDFSPDARPVTDNRIDFDDLMIFSLNFLEVGFTGDPPACPGSASAERPAASGVARSADGPTLTLAFDPPEGEAERVLHVRLVLQQHGENGGGIGAGEAAENAPGRAAGEHGGDMVKGIHAEIDYDPVRLELIDVERGALLEQQPARVLRGPGRAKQPDRGCGHARHRLGHCGIGRGCSPAFPGPGSAGEMDGTRGPPGPCGPS